MKRLIVVALLLAVCWPAYTDKPRRHHEKIGVLEGKVAALEATVQGFVDQSAAIVALEARIKQLEDDITHIDLTSLTLDMPLEVWFAEGPTREWMTARKVPVEEFRGTARVAFVLRFDFRRDVLTGTKYVVVTDAKGVEHKIGSGDFRYAIAFGG